MKIEYESILRRSLSIVKKHKWLLVYGLLIGGGGGISGIRNFSSYSTDAPGSQQESFQEFSTKTTQVLSKKTDLFTEWLSSVSPTAWIALILLVIALILMSIVVALILKNWARASLIHGVQMALEDRPEVTLRNTSPVGVKHTKDLIYFSIMNGLFMFLFIVVVPLIAWLGYLLVKNFAVLKVMWLVVAGISGTVVFVLGLIVIAMIAIYAERLIVLHGVPPYKAWKQGLGLSRNNFLGTLLLGGLNIITSTLVGCVSVILGLIVLGIPTFVLVYPYIKNPAIPNPFVILLLVFFFIVFVFFNLLVKAAIAVFSYSNWNQLFNIVIVHSGMRSNDK